MHERSQRLAMFLSEASSTTVYDDITMLRYGLNGHLESLYDGWARISFASVSIIPPRTSDGEGGFCPGIAWVRVQQVKGSQIRRSVRLCMWRDYEDPATKQDRR